nr:MAG TPA: hypothetical protein [Caudoviricetes sp.]
MINFTYNHTREIYRYRYISLFNNLISEISIYYR